jgi:hypothetical protein
VQALISNRIGGDREWGVLGVPSGGVRVMSDMTEVVRMASSRESLACLWRRGFVSAGVGEGSGGEGARGWKKCAVVTVPPPQNLSPAKALGGCVGCKESRASGF